MNFKEMTDEQIKAYVYDLIVQNNQIQALMREAEAELASRQSQEPTVNLEM
jgi:hypothetical protein